MIAALLVIAILILKFFYPLREPLYRKIIEQKEKKMAGEEYDTSEFEHLF
jgi:Na+/melibiose symporter-like transporter